MGATTHSIDINASVRAVYNQWRQFEEFPRFMEGVQEVRQEGPRNLFWKARIAGKEKRWEAEILEEIPDHRIVWHSVDGTPNSGEVTFEPLEEERTRVTLRMEYEPEGFFEKAGDALGIPSARAEGDLQRFRDFIEERASDTTGWSGRVTTGEKPDFSPPAIRAEQSSSTEAPETSTVTPDREILEFPTVAPINLVEANSSTSRQVTESSTKLADAPSPVATELLGSPDEPQFYRDTALMAKPTTEEIAQRAYELYLERGKAPGCELENWLQAEKELSDKLGATHSGTGT
jgi:Polyketide cyclase / dehydrase and lipid transport/Protein of unknown function (DUF2934)